MEEGQSVGTGQQAAGLSGLKMLAGQPQQLRSTAGQAAEVGGGGVGSKAAGNGMQHRMHRPVCSWAVHEWGSSSSTSIRRLLCSQLAARAVGAWLGVGSSCWGGVQGSGWVTGDDGFGEHLGGI